MMMQGNQAVQHENIGTYSQMTDENNRPMHLFGLRNNIGVLALSPSEGQQRKKVPVSALEGLLSLDYFNPDRMQQEGATVTHHHLPSMASYKKIFVPCTVVSVDAHTCGDK